MKNCLKYELHTITSSAEWEREMGRVGKDRGRCSLSSTQNSLPFLLSVPFGVVYVRERILDLSHTHACKNTYTRGALSV